ncbi:hypothetical protein AUP68_10513 [Ilyonectria robusta]
MVRSLVNHVIAEVIDQMIYLPKVVLTLIEGYRGPVLYSKESRSGCQRIRIRRCYYAVSGLLPDPAFRIRQVMPPHEVSIQQKSNLPRSPALAAVKCGPSRESTSITRSRV